RGAPLRAGAWPARPCAPRRPALLLQPPAGFTLLAEPVSNTPRRGEAPGHRSPRPPPVDAPRPLAAPSLRAATGRMARVAGARPVRRRDRRADGVQALRQPSTRSHA